MSKILLRLLIPPIIVILSVIAFKSGVVVQEKPDLTDMPVGMILFHCISLFGLGAKDLGFPTGGPMVWQYVLVSMYFIAPLVAFAAIAEILYFFTKSFLPLLLLGGGHYLILGYGRKGKSVVNALTKNDQPEQVKNLIHSILGSNRKHKLVIVDENIKENESGFSIFNLNRLKLHAELSDTSILNNLNVGKAKGIFIVTNDEWLNLNLYFKVKEILNKNGNTQASPIIYTSITSSELMHSVHLSELEKSPNDHFFNVHVEASKQLFDSENVNPSLDKEYHAFQAWKRLTFENIVFLGFGRFARAFYHNLVDNNMFIQSISKLVILDKMPEESWQQLSFDYNVACAISPDFIACDLEHLLDKQRLIKETIKGSTLFVFGSNSEFLNLKTATVIHKIFGNHPGNRYLIRLCYKDNFPVHFVKSMLGEETIFVPTHGWTEAFFEDEFKKLKAKYVHTYNPDNFII